ncbi:thiol reductant ABC exporter subunit CydD [Arthrobacter castelli]|uniref:thiol reductant ABC exporter subunit CydD n=1 Tax=Arthrobacter castelli TaxID=271431 RepID=UPI000686F753|nr:thiol reductant ABC exporter subunit CydD [Arthrobacter castelli]
MKPVIPVGPTSRKALYVLGLFAALKAAGLVLLAQAVAAGIAMLAGAGGDWTGVLAEGAAGALLRAAAVWGLESSAQRAAAGVKEELRHGLIGRVMDDGGTVPSMGTGSLSVLVTRGLDGVDNYFAKYLPALVTCAVVPLLVGARILFADWISAVVIVLTVPLVPVFMVLIGLHTRDNVRQASAALDRLSEHLLELARGLPVLVGLGRAGAQTRALRDVAHQYRVKTMETLRVAFLSSLALELIATISVAIVAVFIGVRLINGDMSLELGLLALILAPECYQPLRELGAAHHASEDGIDALGRSRQVTDAPRPRRLVPDGADSGTTGGGADAAAGAGGSHAEADTDGGAGSTAGAEGSAGDFRRSTDFPADLAVQSLTIRYHGRAIPAVDQLDFTVAAGSIAALAGPSGCGKSSVLHVLAGLLGDGPDCHVGGTVRGVRPGATAWIPQHPVLTAGTVWDEIGMYSALPGEAEQRTAAQAVLDQVESAHLIDVPTGELSPGELRRVAVARALARVEYAGAALVLADEPTAHLDADSARAIEMALSGLCGRATVLLVAHNAATRTLADTLIPVGHRGAGPAESPVPDGSPAPTTTAAVPATTVGTAPAPAVVPATTATAADPATAAPADSPSAPHQGPAGNPDAADQTHREHPRRTQGDRPAEAPRRQSLASNISLLKPWSGNFSAALFFGSGSALFAVALTALSGWLIVRASEQPPIMYLLTAIVGVRFFGIGRSVLGYWERLRLHDAVFASTNALRLRLWNGLLERPAAWRVLARGGAVLEKLVGDVDELRDAAPRAVFAPMVGLATAAAACTATWLLVPAGLPVQILLSVVCLVVSPALVLAADRAARRATVELRAGMLEQTSRMVSAAADLTSNNAAGTIRSTVSRLDARLTAALQRSAWAQGLANAVTVLACSASALLMFTVVDGVDPTVAAVVVLMQLGLVEPFSAVNTAAQQFSGWRAVGDRVIGELGSDRVEEQDTTSDESRVTAAERDGSPAKDRGGSTAQGEQAKGEPETSTAPLERVETLQLRNASYTYPEQERPVFSSLSLTLRRGHWLAVTGPSGSGKSTLLGVLLGFLPLAGGEYLINETAARQEQSGSRRKEPGHRRKEPKTRQDGPKTVKTLPQIAWCPQEAHLFNSSIRANLLLARGVDAPPADSEIHAALEQVGLGAFIAQLPEGLDTRIGPGGAWLSGGQRQRLAVARALLTQADVVLLDEPTAHLDRESATALLADLRRGLSGKSVVMVTHHPQDAAVCDEELLLDGGAPYSLDSVGPSGSVRTSDPSGTPDPAPLGVFAS